MNNPERPRLPFTLYKINMSPDEDMDESDNSYRSFNEDERETITEAVNYALSQATNMKEFQKIVEDQTGYKAFPEVYTPEHTEDGKFGFWLGDTFFEEEEGNSRIYFFPKSYDFNDMRTPPPHHVAVVFSALLERI